MTASVSSTSAFASACADLALWIADPPELPPEGPEEDQELFREAAQVHGAAPLLWLRVRDRPAWAESTIGGWLADQHLWNGRRVARLHGELREILAAFSAAGVPILPLKGSVLAALYYEEAAARPMADLDVLLHSKHQEAGEALLAGLGYAKIFSGWKHARFARPGSQQIVDRTREHPDNPRLLEVHPRCRERINDEVVELTDIVLGTARPGEVLGVPSLLPDPDAFWLYLLVHGTHHVLLNNFRLIQLVDLVRLAPFLREADALAETVDPRAVYPALALLERYFPSERTGALRARLRERLPSGYAAWADGLDLFTICHLNPVPWRGK
jgi:hypothetical protein